MDVIIPALLTLAGVLITALVAWLVNRKSTKVQLAQQADTKHFNLMDRYAEYAEKVDKALEERKHDIELLTRQNQERETEISGLRSDMAQIRRDHSLETARMEISLSAFRFYIGTLLDWINQRIEEGELDTDSEIPKPPAEYTYKETA